MHFDLQTPFTASTLIANVFFSLLSREKPICPLLWRRFKRFWATYGKFNVNSISKSIRPSFYYILCTVHTWKKWRNIKLQIIFSSWCRKLWTFYIYYYFTMSITMVGVFVLGKSFQLNTITVPRSMQLFSFT